MSLIQEALKRQQEEMQTSVGTPPPVQEPAQSAAPKALRRPIAPTPPVVPPVQDPAASPAPAASKQAPALKMAAAEPPPIPQAALEVAPAPAREKKSPLILIAGIVILVICGVGSYFLFRPKPIAEPPVAAPAPAPAVTTEPVTAPPVQEPAPANQTPIVAPPVEVAPTPVVTTPQPQGKEPVIWPIITCSGIVGKGDKGSVFLNGQIKTVNETIEDVRIVSIGGMGVTLEYKGEKKFVKVGSSTQ